MRLAGYGLAVDDVLGAMRREHVELPAGRDLFDMSMEVLKESTELLFSVASHSRAGFDRQVLNELDEDAERLVRRIRMLIALLSRQYEMSQERKRA